MTQEEKQLLLKDLCARLPYGVIVNTPSNIFYSTNREDVKLDSIFEIDDNFYVTEDCEWPIETCKPYLRPLSLMTEEEAKDIVTLIGIKDIISINITEKYINVIKDDGFCSTETITIWFNEIVSSIEIFDYLNVHHFDYRNLIEKEFAIEAPEGMY